MPNMKNAKKKVLVNAKKSVTNNNYKASMKNAIKNVEKAIDTKDKKKATEALKIALQKIDKAAGKGKVKQNNCSRNKSRLTKKVNLMK